ncbi:MAG: threonine--tRNA ligase [Candidatus Ryanbacteria bacterium RIFCSPHIGHO2_02_FULL_45_43]|uniref:Threonine--tRNA ligase n=1 Tax=Candidatus Ryanbacteria bacterium RIFCSPHIGHO2_01_45_13 TaxID=1802112 RepID=A0A1G2FZL9_9BACT|nr:MAG: threonine--tRNA ligase [Candidatus Ryanbacteria bacterium RIFCSPHIGHO2_01_FULL_44_130]OGZ43509.1 MAG: threonine--tRNA ligase [Candidatus Ryanbacteria bacterium RIFCSPHIGHO2_01_45_13]OGZ47853.1 MAG: threonine--tRNA ligase [Candidatus Ryanbacteria bacterium RIFCSPHIGHO2_02_FULL_45_43]OGZ49898.1 MAG: threonine--tRNA ligase [Candidatus Ryanbacteria bacterium RIFCSPHIGHO2_12_FULL_44_20]OGZ51008.1 MAG: threonine--tRNA ligase [Candidatus Ryanbacteria bacterium RIFCSPLOWO2_01_FULL_44_230]OGZ54
MKKNKKTQIADELERMRHTLSHLLAMAVMKKYPKAKLGIGPTIEDGFYYDFELPNTLKEEELEMFEQEMRKLIKKGLGVLGREISADEARTTFKNQPYKLELIYDYEKEHKKLTVYTIDDFTDLCKGGHVQNTTELDPNAFKLTRLAGAYWKGNEKNNMLTRIYGVAFKSTSEIDAYIKKQEQAQKRDHRKLGKELDLFVFSELIGGGLPLFTPKGTILRDLLDNKVWKLREANGYKRVDIPHMTKKDLYEKSGHWEKFKDELLHVTTREEHQFVLKPMNCPHHIQIFARRPISYREMPVRYANTTKVYRDEQTGELMGLTRVRSITQDDAHIFCRVSQINEEVEKIWDIIEEFYKQLDLDVHARLSTRDPATPEKYIGAPKKWEMAEESLRKIIKTKRGKKDPEESKGEAAFYGPKIDFNATDSLGRKWQVATIQLDMNQPERFDLTCINEKGEKERIVMIHAAIMGSIERLLAILIEHNAGAFPLWLAPVQVAIIPVNDKNEAYVKKTEELLLKKHIRFETDRRNESLNKKIREAELQKIPYLLVVGDKEKKSKTVSVREREKGDRGSKKLEKFLQSLKMHE